MNIVVTLTPNPSLDLSYTLADDDHLGRPEIEVHRAAVVTLEASGKGINVTRTQAHALTGTRAGTRAGVTRAGGARPEVRPVAVLPVAGATGAHLVALLTADGLDHTTVEVDGETRINTTITQPALGSTTKVNSPGPTLTDADADALLAATAARLADAAPGPDDELWLAVCGSFPPGLPAQFVARLVRVAHDHGARIAVDTAGPTLLAALEAGADLLAPNVGELSGVDDAVRLATTNDGTDGIDGGGTDGVAALFAACARVAADRGCQLLVSLGADGALWTDGASTVHAATEPVVARNTAGAGDALLAGWLAGGPPAERLARAVGWGRATCLSATTVADPAALAAAAEVAVQVTSHTH